MARIHSIFLLGEFSDHGSDDRDFGAKDESMEEDFGEEFVRRSFSSLVELTFVCLERN